MCLLRSENDTSTATKHAKGHAENGLAWFHCIASRMVGTSDGLELRILSGCIEGSSDIPLAEIRHFD